MCAKRITSQDVADLAGVSRTTVSLVLNNIQEVSISQPTRQRVQLAAEKLGYVPNASAQALVNQRSQIVGLFLTRSLHHIASDTFITQVIDGLLAVIHQYGLRLLIDVIPPEHQKEAYLQLFRAKRIDGILLSGPRIDDKALIALEEEGYPAVIVGQLPKTNICMVDVDNYSAARQAVSHLIRLGHRRIACITNAPTIYTAAQDRLSGYRDALAESGIPFQEELVRFGDFNLESGYERMRSLLRAGAPFSAAFIASDVVAFGAMTAIREAGLCIPKDIALVGFDDLPIARFTDPPLTSIHLPAVELGRQACDLLIQIMSGSHLPTRRTLLDTHLVIRQSCGAGLAPAE